MINNARSTVTLMALAASAIPLLLGLTGCAKHPKPKPAAPLQPLTHPQAPPDVHAEFRTMESRVNQLYVTGNQLPGGNDAAHRRLMEQAFAQLIGILPTLEGGTATGTFRQQLRIIDASRQQLATSSSPLTLDATVDTGMRATYNILKDLARRDYPNEQAISNGLDQLQANLDDLDKVRGPLHQLVAADAVQDTAQVLRAMTMALGERLPPPATVPTNELPTTSELPTTAPVMP
jgi:hypothetical protein